MPDDDKPDTTQPATVTTVETTTAPAQEAPRTFTQEQLNTIVGQRIAEDRVRRPAKQEPAKAEKPAAESDLRAELEEMKLRNAFDKRVAKLDLKPEADEDLFTLYKAQRPQDPDAWVKSKIESLGLKAATMPTPNSTTTPAATTGAAASTTQPAKVDPVTSGGIPDLWNMTSEQLTLLGPQGIREIHERALAVGTRMTGAPPLPKVMQRK